MDGARPDNSETRRRFLNWFLGATAGVLYEAQKTHKLARSGPYAQVRHPQYDGFVLIMLGFLLQWPTIITLTMFPILVTMYVKLARREEEEVLIEFGEEYRSYMSFTPAFLPRLGRHAKLRGRRSDCEPERGQTRAGMKQMSDRMKPAVKKKQ